MALVGILVAMEGIDTSDVDCIYLLCFDFWIISNLVVEIIRNLGRLFYESHNHNSATPSQKLVYKES